MHENEIAKVVVDVGFHIHQQLGPGLLESVYEAIMLHELRKTQIVCRESGSSSRCLGWGEDGCWFPSGLDCRAQGGC